MAGHSVEWTDTYARTSLQLIARENTILLLTCSLLNIPTIYMYTTLPGLGLGSFLPLPHALQILSIFSLPVVGQNRLSENPVAEHPAFHMALSSVRHCDSRLSRMP